MKENTKNMAKIKILTILFLSVVLRSGSSVKPETKLTYGLQTILVTIFLLFISDATIETVLKRRFFEMEGIYVCYV